MELVAVSWKVIEKKAEVGGCDLVFTVVMRTN